MVKCRKTPTLHIFAIMLGSLEIMLFGGVIFGWHSVVYIYKETNYFSHLCHNNHRTFNFSKYNMTWHYYDYRNMTTKSTMTNHTSLPMANSSDVNLASVTTATNYNTPNNMNDVPAMHEGYDVVNSEPLGASIHFDELTCKEKLRVRAEEGGGAGICKEQDQQFNLIFSLATVVNGVLCFPSGILYDKLGTRISRIISIVSFITGQLFLIFASSSTPYLLYPGFVFLVYGGYQILLTNLQLANLVPSLRSTIMSVYSGSYDTSASVFLLFKTAYEGGVSVNACFAAQCVFYVLVFGCSTFLLLPATRIPFPRIPGYRLRCYLCQKFCRLRGHRGRLPFTSKEWQVDMNGSMILVVPASNKVHDKHGGCDKDKDNSGNHDNQQLLLSKNHDTSASNDKGGGDATEEIKRTDVENENAVNVQASDIAENVPPENGGESGQTDSQADARNDSSGNGEIKVSNLRDVESKRPETPNHEEDVASPATAAEETEGMLREKKKTFKQVAFSLLFLTDLLWISVHRLRSWIFVGMFNPWITRLACGDKALVSHYTSVYAGLQFFGILTAPLSGQLMDRKIKGGEKYGNPRHERLEASIASFVLNSTVAVLLTICTLIPVLKLQYVTFALHCLHRSFLYGPNSAFVANAFPNEHFGKLFGVTLTVSALFAILQYPLFVIMQGPLNGNPMAINVFLLILMIISFVHPLYIWRFLKKKAKKPSS